ncbi:MAG: DUF4332 domain-containing protein [Planctomycetaceae bacterium]
MPALTSIEGIGETYADHLAAAGIGSTHSLLKKGSTRTGRKEIAKQSGVKPAKVLEWVNKADLFRVKGVGEEYSDLLEAAGVDTVPELANRNASNLWQKLSDVNEKRRLVRRIPALSTVETWIKQAKSLPRVVEY